MVVGRFVAEKKRRGWWQRFTHAVVAVAVFATALGVSAVSPPLAGAAGSIGFSQRIVGDPASVGSNETFVYEIDLSCSSLTDNCGVTTFVDALPGGVEFLGVDLSGAPDWESSFAPGSNTLTVEKSDGSAFQDASAIEFFITVRVRPDFDPTSGPLVNDPTTTSDNGTPPADFTPLSITVVNSAGWMPVKSQTVPSAGVDPALDQPITYAVSMCGPTTGNVELADMILVDTYPAGATVVDPDGGTVGSGTITWVLDPVDQATLAAAGGDTYCQTFSPQLEYPTPAFSEGQSITNVLDGLDGAAAGDGTVACANSGPGGLCRGQVISTLVTASADLGVTKRGDPTISEQGILTYRMSVGTLDANAPTSNVVATDILPSGMRVRGLDVSRGDYGFEIHASTDGGSSWTEIANQNPGGRGARSVWQQDFDSTFGPDAVVNAVEVRFFEGTGASKTFVLAPGLEIDIDLYASTVQTAPPPVGSTIDNCFTASGDGANATRCHQTEVTTDQSVFGLTKSVDDDTVVPGQEQLVSLRLFADSNNAIPLTNPVMFDLLPADFEYVSFVGVASDLPPGHAALPDPVVEVIDDHNASGRQLIRFSWPGWALDRTLADQLVAGDFADKEIEVQFNVRPRAGAPAAIGYNNLGGADVDDPAADYCRSRRQTPSTDLVDTDDLDGDGSTSDVVCVNDLATEVLPAAALAGNLWDDGHPSLPHVDTTLTPPAPDPACPQYAGDAGFTRFPCAAQSLPNQAFPYKIEIINQGNTALDEYWLYDILPHVGDVGVNEALVGDARESAWAVQITGGVTIADLPGGNSTYVVEYSDSYNPCRDEMANPSTPTPWPAGCVDDWTTTPDSWPDVKSFRIYVPFDVTAFDGGENFVIDVPALIPAGSPFGTIAWNSVAHRADNAATNTQLLPAAPRKVGIRIPDGNPISQRVGNLVWIDVDDDGLADVGEPGVAGIGVELYRESGDATGFDADDTLVGSTTTDANGIYFFEVEPEEYYVAIPAEQGTNAPTADFGGGAVPIPVSTLASSTSTTLAEDDDDNTDDGASASAMITVSTSVTISDDGEPMAEADSNIAPARNAEAYVEANGGTDFDDVDSNLTVDLGLTLPQRLGGLVWLDGALGEIGYDNGEADATEAAGPIEGVTVDLIRDIGTVGDFEDGVDLVIDSTTTDASGNYVFSPVEPGQYFVGVADNAATATYRSSTGASDPSAGLDDVDDGSPTAGYASMTASFAFTATGNPTDERADFETGTGGEAEADANAGSRGFHLDDRSDLSIDFGFITMPTYEIGNLVWHDLNDDGEADADEPGIPGVRVELWEDSTGDGAGDELFGATDTDATGKYSFVDVPAGDYVVVVASDQSTATDPDALEDMRLGTNGIEADPDSDGDNNQNGATTTTLGATSGLLTVGEGVDFADEPTDETDESTTGTPDDRSNLTVDFAYAQDLRVGGLVWRDEGVADASADDALATVGENGLDGVIVQLLDVDDGVLDETLTDGTGTYSFTGLAPGSYRIGIPDGQAVLDGVVSSQGTNGAGSASANPEAADNDDDGDPVGAFASRSGIVILANGSEPVDEADSNVDPARDTEDFLARSGGPALLDANSNLHIDFGFISTPTLSVGNRVWADWNDNGLRDLGEPGISGVAVELWVDGSTTPTLIDTTDDDGYYFFEGIETEGDYLVVVPASNFETSLDVLYGWRASSVVDDADDDVDNTNDGAPDGASDDVVSGTFALSFDDEPELETDLTHASIDFDAPYDDHANVSIDFGFTTTSIGDRVWFDSNNNGVQDPGEPGLVDVDVELWSSPAAGPAQLLGSTSTDALGDYLFIGVTQSPVEVVIASANFEAAGALADLSSVEDQSVDAPSIDADDDGIEHGSGLGSGPVTLVPGAAPTVDDSDEGTVAGSSGLTLPDANEDLTIDFGFHAMSIGNRIFIDADANGAMDDSELGRADVTVELWLPDGDTPLLSTVTDDDGYYRFTGLAEGDYVVRIPVSNFEAGGALFGYTSSVGNGLSAPDPDVVPLDRDDNGALDAENYVSSTVVTLEPGAEPLGELDLDRADDRADDRNANLTVDFGFVVRPGLAIGNRVFFDEDGDRFQGDGEPGIDGVRVELLDDDGGLVAVDETSGGGYYLFPLVAADGALLEGTYSVRIPASNFDEPRDPLYGLISSPDAGIGAPDADFDPADLDDNGTDPALAFDDVVSWPVVLSDQLEPLGELDVEGPSVTGDENENLTVDFGFTRLALGNLVFVDNDDDARFDPSLDETVPNVELALLDESGEPVVTSTGVEITAVTDADGLYSLPLPAPGEYVVEVAASNFALGGALAGFASSDANDVDGAAPDPDLVQLDDDDNGTPTGATPFTGDAVRTASITAEIGIDPTIDFGFYAVPGLELGNLVFRDVDNDGVFTDIDEPAGAGVILNLLTADAAPVLDVDGVPVVTVTGPDGIYVFSGLAEGGYIVELDESNFAESGALEGLWASTGPGASDDPERSGDGNSDGVQGVSVRSGVVTLALDSEPTDEQDASPNGIDSAFSNLTVDFGLYASDLAVGVELPESVDDAVVLVVTDAQCVEIPGSDSQPMTSAVDDSGLAIVTGLPDGTVHVAVPASEFAEGSALDGVTVASQDDADRLVDGCVVSEPIEVMAAELEGETVVVLGAVQLAEAGRVVNRVWNDIDRDGVQDPNEPGLAGVEIRLLDAAESLVASTTSGPDGEYEFDGLVPGTYTVEVTAPQGMQPTTEGAGDDDSLDSDLDETTSRGSFIVTSGAVVEFGIGFRAVSTEPPPVLAFTGVNPAATWLGSLLLAVGLLLVAASRRRESAHS